MKNWQTKKGAVSRLKYKSGLEDQVAEQLTSTNVPFKYEPSDGKIKYTVPAEVRSYTPDFYITTKSGKTIIVETKGLWDSDDRKKHRLIKEQYPELDIRFVFHRSKTKLSKRSNTTYADICEGKGRGKFKGLKWKYADKQIPIEWINE